MPNVDVLTSALTDVARGLRRARIVRAAACAASLMLLPLLLWQVLRSFGAAPAVASALGLLLALLAFTGVLALSWRALRPVPLALAAGVADAGADLKDELKTAYYLSGRDSDSAIVELQLRRAQARAAQLDARALVPVRAPRIALLALALALACAGVAWIGPRPEHQLASTTAARLVAPRDSALAPAPQVGSEPTTSEIEPQRPALAEASRSGVRGERDVTSQSASPAAARTKVETAGLDGSSALVGADSNSTKSKDATVSELVAALQELFNPQLDEARKENRLEANSVDRSQRTSERALDESARGNVEESKDDAATRAVPLANSGQPPALRSQGEGGEVGGRTNAEGGALGRRVTQSASGAGGDPEGGMKGAAEGEEKSAPLLGERTVPLAARLKQSADPGNRQPGLEEALYAVTRAQDSAVDYIAIALSSRQVREDGASALQLPYVYRDAVRDYFLGLRRREP